MTTFLRNDVREQFHAWLAAQPDGGRGVGRALVAGLEQGEYFLLPEDASGPRPIPAILSPCVVDDAALDAVRADARRVLAATTRFARCVRGGLDVGLPLFAAFSETEHAALFAQPHGFERVATVRVDFFLDADGRPWLLEQNTTIPALQGYTHLLASAFGRAVGQMTGRGAVLPSNGDELLASLVAHHRDMVAGASSVPSIVLVCRRNDPEFPELRGLMRLFAARGHVARNAFVDELEVDSAGRVSADGQEFDIVYRHVFARRVASDMPFHRALVTPGASTVLNPVTSPLEVKAMLALLHQSLTEPALATSWGATDDELAAVERIVPWSRVVRPGPGRTPDGAIVPDLMAWAQAHGDALVLKRSWDFGGRSVFLGKELGAGWRPQLEQAVQAEDVWILQQRISGPQSDFVRPTEDGGLVREKRYSDVSLYLSQGIDACPTGGTCRVSPGPIVNVAGGGALSPLVTVQQLASIWSP